MRDLPTIAEGERLASEIAPGDCIGGRYLIEEALGSGGMGIIFAARHEALGNRVAIKLVLGSTTAEGFVRFSREARIIASLESEHVVRVMDFGDAWGHALHGDGTPFGARSPAGARVEGPDPRDGGRGLRRPGLRRSGGRAQEGNRHRDVKLGNLFLAVRADGERVVKVLDFGISKLQADTQDNLTLTRTASTLGSPTYMSPEQVRDPRTVDSRADIWSLGVVLYQLLADQPPFTGLNANAVCARHRRRCGASASDPGAARPPASLRGRLALP